MYILHTVVIVVVIVVIVIIIIQLGYDTVPSQPHPKLIDTINNNRIKQVYYSTFLLLLLLLFCHYSNYIHVHIDIYYV